MQLATHASNTLATRELALLRLVRVRIFEIDQISKPRHPRPYFHIRNASPDLRLPNLRGMNLLRS
jgi:hypothetical protein